MSEAPGTAVYAFDVRLDPDEAAEAERRFYLQSALRLRRWRTFGPPIGFALFLALSVATKQPAVFAVVWALLLVLSMASPAFFYFARPAAARRDAAAHPVRSVELRDDALVMHRDGRTAQVPWARIGHVWQLAGHELLLFGPYAAIALPQRDLPAGAHEFILSHAGRRA